MRLALMRGHERTPEPPDARRLAAALLLVCPPLARRRRDAGEHHGVPPDRPPATVRGGARWRSPGTTTTARRETCQRSPAWPSPSRPGTPRRTGRASWSMNVGARRRAHRQPRRHRQPAGPDPDRHRPAGPSLCVVVGTTHHHDAQRRPTTTSSTTTLPSTTTTTHNRRRRRRRPRDHDDEHPAALPEPEDAACGFCVHDRIQHRFRIENHLIFHREQLLQDRCAAVEFPRPIFQVAADGTQSSIFDVTQVVEGSCQTTLTDPNPRFLDDSFQPIANPDPDFYGSVFAIDRRPDFVRFNYTHPTTPPDAGDKFRVIRIGIFYTDQRNPGGPASGSCTILEIRVYRPPVLMIHGLWSDASAFADMEQDARGVELRAVPALPARLPQHERLVVQRQLPAGPRRHRRRHPARRRRRPRGRKGRPGHAQHGRRPQPALRPEPRLRARGAPDHHLQHAARGLADGQPAPRPDLRPAGPPLQPALAGDEQPLRPEPRAATTAPSTTCRSRAPRPPTS